MAAVSYMNIAGLVKKVALFIFSLSIAFILAELFIRYVFNHYDEPGRLSALVKTDPELLNVRARHPLAAVTRLSTNKSLIYDLRPDRELIFGHKRVRINPQGMRDSGNYTTNKPPNTLRVIGLGDSGMFGWGVHQNEMYTELLETYTISGSRSKIEVLNMAVPGYNSYQQVEAFRAKGIYYSPDLVIVHWCFNDYELPFFMYTPQKVHDFRFSYLYAYFFDRDTFRKKTLPDVRELNAQEKLLVDENVLSSCGPTGVREAFASLKNMCGKQGSGLLVFGPLASTEISMLNDLGIAYLNTYEQLPAEKYPSDFKVHFMHPRPGGHQALASMLYEYIIKFVSSNDN